MFVHSWTPAPATIVARHFKESGDTSGVWEYVADVMPADGAPFRTTLKQPPFMSHVVRLAVGQTVTVLADAKHQDAKFDRSDPQINGSKQRSDADDFRDALREPPVTPPPNPLS